MEELIEKVEQWSIERGLNTADPNKQRLKLWEEFGELNASMARNDREGAIDAIGDMLVVMIIYKQQLGYGSNDVFEPKQDNLDFLGRLEDSALIDYVGYGIVQTRNYIQSIEQVVDNLTMLAYRLGTNLEECLAAAYDVIKDRRGKMVNGVFVKESDLNGKSQSKWNKIYQKQRNNQLMRAWNKSKKEVIFIGQRHNQNILGKR